jgi:light-regulated signal transduction histidine kinase (bacteriophytochrome)
MNRARVYEPQSPELSRLIPSISHDLKEPLRTLRCHTELLAAKLKQDPDPEVGTLLTYIREAAERLQRLVDDATAFALAETPRAERGRVNMEEALHFALSNLQTSIAERKAMITADPMPAAVANFEALARIFQNLIGNSIKYSKKRPRIHVGCVKRGAECTVSVEDHGIGIDPEFHEMVFQPFKRLHSQKKYPGTGLGLAICRRVIESYGGRIWVESAPGEGSTFYFTIPAARGATSSEFERRGAGMRHASA